MGKQTPEHIKKRIDSFKKNYKKENHHNFGKYLSEETKRKISLSSMGKPATYGRLGKHNSQETRNKISKSMQGLMINEKNGLWKGDNVGYDALHCWIQRKLGKPFVCNRCNENNLNKKYEWHNISGKYKRDTNDWERLCIKCHRIHHKKQLQLK